MASDALHHATGAIIRPHTPRQEARRTGANLRPCATILAQRARDLAFVDVLIFGTDSMSFLESTRSQLQHFVIGLHLSRLLILRLTYVKSLCLKTLGWEETVHSPPDRMECESRDLTVSAKHLVKPQETSGDWLDGFESQIGDEFSDHESDDGKAVASQDERIDVTTPGLTDVNDTHNQETAFMMKKKSTEGS
ncbi:hypothetical protein E4T47_05045 [Aureobasidium subglaciale]|nr:hypothetical protein E4T47_05045 [Aureobasidium subglaciale]